MLVFATVLHGCGDASDPAPALPLASRLYVQTLYAMMNLNGCRSQELLAKAQGDLSAVESLAFSMGLEHELERGRISFEKQIAEELHVVCDPNEQGASKQAHEAIEKLRVHVGQLPLGADRPA